MIVVAGGTGRLGSRVAERLRSSGQDVVAWGSRDADLRTVNAARLGGVATVVSCVNGFPRRSPARVDRDGTASLAHACERAESDLVLLSAAGASPTSPMELFRMKYAAEQLVRASGVRWTIVRPDAFVETWVEILVRSSGRSERPVVPGRGRTGFAWVSVDDVAAEVARVALDPSSRGETVEVLGAETYTLTDLAERVMRAQGWTGTPRHVPGAALRVGGLLPGRPGRLARAALAMDLLGSATREPRQPDVDR